MNSEPDSTAAYPVILVGALQARAGKTGVAAALALKLAYEGRRVQALRLGGDESDTEAAGRDAAFLQSLPFTRGRGGRPLSVEEAGAAAQDQLSSRGILVLEAPSNADLVALSEQLNAGVILAVRSADATAIAAVQGLANQLGPRLLGLVAVAVPRKLLEPAHAALQAASTPVLAIIPEDAVLYAPNVLEVADALDAEIILGEPTEENVIERFLIGSITTDPGQPYYARPRSKRAVITRSDRTDLQLAAMHTDVDCLILTGGVDPSPYTIDRAADEEIVVLLTRLDTRGAAKRLENIFTSTRFASEEKLERMLQLLDESFAWGRLQAALPTT
jgi:BioD-like phosphotransacetylase family protein